MILANQECYLNYLDKPEKILPRWVHFSVANRRSSFILRSLLMLKITMTRGTEIGKTVKMFLMKKLFFSEKCSSITPRGSIFKTLEIWKRQEMWSSTNLPESVTRQESKFWACEIRLKSPNGPAGLSVQFHVEQKMRTAAFLVGPEQEKELKFFISSVRAWAFLSLNFRKKRKIKKSKPKHATILNAVSYKN